MDKIEHIKNVELLFQQLQKAGINIAGPAIINWMIVNNYKALVLGPDGLDLFTIGYNLLKFSSN